jgi:hypothetical protein
MDSTTVSTFETTMVWRSGTGERVGGGISDEEREKLDDGGKRVEAEKLGDAEKLADGISDDERLKLDDGGKREEAGKRDEKAKPDDEVKRPVAVAGE